MAKGSNTWCKKLMHKQKVQGIRKMLGPCKRLDTRGLNGGQEIGCPATKPESVMIPTGTRYPAVSFKRSFGKWAKYAPVSGDYRR